MATAVVAVSTPEPTDPMDKKHFEERLAASQAALEAHRANQTLPTAFAPADEYLPVDRMLDCLLPDNHPDAPKLRNGVASAADGSLFVATTVLFPGVDTAAFAWWFTSGCPGDDEYRTWHPEDHVSGHFVAAYEALPGGEAIPEEPWAGLEHVVVEALGAKFGGHPQSLRIKFQPLAAYGLDRTALEDAHCDVALVARVCVKDAIFGWLDVGHFLHFTQPLPNNAAGFELRSRFWLGDVDLPTDGNLSKRLLSPLVRLVANTRGMRSAFARLIEGRSPLELAVSNWRHATEEFSVLASFLADVYNDATNDNFKT